jgi:hypothetical protein
MSDHQIDLEAILAKLARDRAETEKFGAETQKFTAEIHKLMREAEKFRAEEWKVWRDWRMAPWVFVLGLCAAAIGGVIARHLP